jgi:hypothetical protein
MLGLFAGGSKNTALQAVSFMQLAQLFDAALCSMHIPEVLMYGHTTAANATS